MYGMKAIVYGGSNAGLITFDWVLLSIGVIGTSTINPQMRR